MIPLGILMLSFRIPGSHSLKEKRGILKPAIASLKKSFNVTVAEVDHQDAWQVATLACAMVGSDRVAVERCLQAIPQYCEQNFRALDLFDQEFEFF